jgi:hypothetical protein
MRASSSFLSALPLTVLVVGSLLLRHALTPERRSLADLMAVAEKQGLHWAQDGRGDGIRRVVVSVQPIDSAAETIPFGAGGLRQGVVACYAPRDRMGYNYDPAASVLWGDVFVWGDPSLIERLTGLRPESQ